MTLVVTVNGPELIWLLSDRRLCRGGQPSKEDARKVMFLDTTDGAAILGYAGLGETTPRGTEPSDWMGAALRCRNLPLEQSLGVLALAMEKQFPPHMGGLPTHDVLVTAFLSGEPRLYRIGLAVAPDRKSYAVRCTRVVNRPPPATSRTPRIGMAGSGGIYLAQRKEQLKENVRSLLNMVRANDRGKVSPHAVADLLANLNSKVHDGIRDKSVGSHCIVAWRHKKGGGGHQLYTGTTTGTTTVTTRDASSPCLPTIAREFDVKALMNLPHITKTFEMLKARRAGQPANELSKDEINAELARLPNKPDENLR